MLKKILIVLVVLAVIAAIYFLVIKKQAATVATDSTNTPGVDTTSNVTRVPVLRTATDPGTPGIATILRYSGGLRPQQ